MQFSPELAGAGPVFGGVDVLELGAAGAGRSDDFGVEGFGEGLEGKEAGFQVVLDDGECGFWKDQGETGFAIGGEKEGGEWG